MSARTPSVNPLLPIITTGPVVMIGNNGLTEGVLAEIEIALAHHELIKVKIAGEDRDVK
ncbi:YhbY family RNA-binding protein, partial [Proteus mirabilis]|uniref:YhbY family RNA-binding protein n=1 Tax=Proteus mirabilis TaxID=584 RepID=UPI001073EC43